MSQPQNLFSLSYQGVRAPHPPNVIVKNFDPSPTTSSNVAIGDFWINFNPFATPQVTKLWVLLGLSGGVATWVEIIASAGDILSLTGNSGGAINPVAGNINIRTANSTAIFAGTPANLTLDFGASTNLLVGTVGSLTAGSFNTAFGKNAGAAINTGNFNTAFGYEALQDDQTGNNNTAVGGLALNSTTGAGNTAVGFSALGQLVGGANNIALGTNAAINYVGGETSNIIVGNPGLAAENTTIRIGIEGLQTACYIAGISGVTPANQGNVVIDTTTGQLGVGSGGTFIDSVTVIDSDNNATSPAEANLIKNRSGGPVVAGDQLGCLNFVGFDSNSLPIISASICSYNPVGSTIAPDQVAGTLRFSTHPDSASGVTPTLRMVLSETGALTLNQADADLNNFLSNSFINQGSGVIASSSSATNVRGAIAQIQRTHGGAAIVSGDTIGSLNFTGYTGGGAYTAGASITSVSSGTIAANRVAGNLVFATHPDSVTSTTATTRMTLNSDGQLSINKADNDSFVAAGTPTLQVLGNSLISADDTNGVSLGPVAAFTRSRNAGVITSGDVLGGLQFEGNDGTQLVVGASIRSTSSGTIAANRVAGNLVFSTHPDSPSGVSSTPRMTINSAGDVIINQADNDSFVAIPTQTSLSVVGNSLLSQDDTNGVSLGGFSQFLRTRAGGIITTGDVLGSILFSANDGTKNITGGAISCTSAGTIGVNRVPGVLNFFTHKDSATGIQPTLRMGIDQNGIVVINPPDTNTAVLQVQGSISAQGDPGVGVASSTDFTNATAAAGGGAGAVALQAGGVGVAQAGWLKIYVNGVVSYIPYYQ